MSAVFLLKCNLFAYFAKVSGRDVEKRSDVLQREHLNHLWTAAEQFVCSVGVSYSYRLLIIGYKGSYFSA